ncbi:MAG: NPCBM/NEW2 domain-containing protein, partial [Bacilli bacterium]|nr:NPCBM/NEW2 domain-containing protein [Bacilli bacterium]
VNNIDVGDTEDFKKIYSETEAKIVEIVKEIVSTYDKDLDYEKAIKVIEEGMSSLTSDGDSYKELVQLKESFENKLPDSLLDKYSVAYTSGSNSSTNKKVINDKEYESYISFSFTGGSESRVYRLNKDYKTLKTSIVIGEDWDKEFSGYIVIYGDDKELYKSDNITKESEPVTEIELNVANVDDLKLEFVTEDKSLGWDSFNIYLVEPYLYK